MRVLITGAAGFIGQHLAKALLNDEEGKYTLILTDVVEPPVPQNVKWPEKVTGIKADLVKEAEAVIDKDLDAVYAFHGIMSSGSEANFDLGKIFLFLGAYFWMNLKLMKLTSRYEGQFRCHQSSCGDNSKDLPWCKADLHIESGRFRRRVCRANDGEYATHASRVLRHREDDVRILHQRVQPQRLG